MMKLKVPKLSPFTVLPNNTIPQSAISQAITNEQWDHAIMLLEKNKGMAKQYSSRSGFFEGLKASVVLPIHEACANSDTPFRLVQILATAYPESLLMKESAYARLPLHIACRKNANLEVVAFLLAQYPHASLVPDTLGRLPIHYALSNGANDALLDLLIQKSPNSARGTDRRGWLPLHVACSVGASTHVIEIILKAYPEASIHLTNKGTTVERCMDSHQAMNKPEIYALLAQHREVVHEKLGRPALKPSEDRIMV